MFLMLCLSAIYLDLKDPDGCKRSNFRKILLNTELVLQIAGTTGVVSYHPAAFDNAGDSIRGVSIQGFLMVV